MHVWNGNVTMDRPIEQQEEEKRKIGFSGRKTGGRREE